jgi:fructoselysine-6-P-deglycase FrlB-like protein
MDPAAFRDDVLAGPATLRALADAYGGDESPLRTPAGQRAGSHAAAAASRVILTGLGSSLSAARGTAARLRAQGRDATAEPASAAPERAAPPAQGTLLVAISASGRTPETVAAAERHRDASAVVALTNEPASPLAEAADAALPLLAGPERGGVACRTFQATLAVLHLLFGTGDTGLLHRAADAADRLCASRAGWLPEALAVLEGAAVVDVVGPEERRPSFEQAALMLREGPRVVAAGWEAGDWLHVGVYLTVHPGWRGVVLTGARHQDEVLDWLARRRARFVAIGASLPGAAARVALPGAEEPEVAALVETVAVELLAAELWERALARRPG